MAKHASTARSSRTKPPRTAYLNSNATASRYRKKFFELRPGPRLTCRSKMSPAARSMMSAVSMARMPHSPGAVRAGARVQVCCATLFMCASSCAYRVDRTRAAKARGVLDALLRLQQLEVARRHPPRVELLGDVRARARADAIALSRVGQKFLQDPRHLIDASAGSTEAALLDHSVRIEQRDHRNAAPPGLQEGVRETLDVGRVQVQSRSSEPFTDPLVGRCAGHDHVRQGARRRRNLSVILFVAGQASADDDERPVRQSARKLDDPIGALDAPQVSHPEHVDVALCVDFFWNLCCNVHDTTVHS